MQSIREKIENVQRKFLIKKKGDAHSTSCVTTFQLTLRGTTLEALCDLGLQNGDTFAAELEDGFDKKPRYSLENQKFSIWRNGSGFEVSLKTQYGDIPMPDADVAAF